MRGLRRELDMEGGEEGMGGGGETEGDGDGMSLVEMSE